MGMEQTTSPKTAVLLNLETFLLKIPPLLGRTAEFLLGDVISVLVKVSSDAVPVSLLPNKTDGCQGQKQNHKTKQRSKNLN